MKKLIKKRLLARLRGKNNMIKEVENLHKPFGSSQGKQGLSWQRLDDLGLEYRYISRYLHGLINKQEMIEVLEKEIYRLRQASNNLVQARQKNFLGGKLSRSAKINEKILK